jgi:hypothetical protein
LEDYLLSLIIQHDNPKKVLEKCLLILKDYKFEADSYQKILSHLSGFLKNKNNLNVKDFLNVLPKELTESFDSLYLCPMLAFEEEDKYVEEVEKVAGELRVLFLKNKIREISDNLKKGEKEEDVAKIEDLEKELSSAIGLLGRS